MISQIKRFKKLPLYMTNHWLFLEKNNLIRKIELIFVLFLSTLTVILEALGLSILIPLLSLIEHSGDIEQFKSSSVLCRYVADIFFYFGIPINLANISLTAFALILFRQIVNYFTNIENERLKWKVHKRLSVETINRIMSAKLKYVQDIKPGHFTNTSTNEAGDTAAILRCYGALWMTLMVFIAYTLILLITSLKITFMIMIFLFTLMILLSGIIRLTKKYSSINLEYRRQFFNFLNERFTAWKFIVLTNSLDNEINHAENINTNIYNNQVKLLRLQGLLGLLFLPLASLFLLVTLNLFVTVLHIDLTVITTFGLAFVRLMPVTLNIQSNINKLVAYFPSYLYVEKIFNDAGSNSVNRKEGIILSPLKKEIEYRNVSFNYEGRKDFALKDINFCIKSGSFVSIIGHSGAGKSTLIDLLPRMIEPNEGSIYYDGIDIKKCSIESLRSNIAYVTQEPFLFNSTIIDNLRYTKSEATEDEIWDALKLAHAYDFVKSFPKGLQTDLGTLGKKISGGQRQRIVLARTFLSDASIIILDEPTSALDNESDLKIQSAIDTLKNKIGATIIIIAHRFSTINKSDIIINLDQGQIIKNRNKDTAV
ncbi:MAG: hypothetical protein CMJ14_07765 [Pelagibacterales bacterium]|nr:hypothetical protein [Pelagibacterales bacterium]|tara:strand:- start:2796 stop:4583 length:1788 start_codon:yes stop_codon:yes gene_type:complete